MLNAAVTVLRVVAIVLFYNAAAFGGYGVGTELLGLHAPTAALFGANWAVACAFILTWEP